MNQVIISRKFQSPNAGRWIEKAIKLAGSQAELARRLEEKALVRCYPQKVNEWRMRGVVPPYWVRHLADILKVDPKEIDPLLYG